MAAQRRRRRRRKSEWPYILVGTALFVVAAGVIGWVISDRLTHREIVRDASQCVRDQKPPADTIVLIDQTTPFSDNEKNIVTAILQREQAALSVNARLSLYLVNADEPLAPTLKLARCNPGSGAEADPLRSDPEYVQSQWTENFAVPVANALDEALKPSESQNSPIIENVKGLQIAGVFANSGHTRLVIISDMLEYSDLIDLYASSDERRTLQTLQSSARASELLPDLHGVFVHIDLLQDKQSLPHQDLVFRRFWRDYFAQTVPVGVDGL